MSDLNLSIEQTMYVPRHDDPVGSPEHAWQEAVRGGDMKAAQKAWAILAQCSQAVAPTSYPLWSAVKAGRSDMMEWLLTLDVPAAALGYAVAQTMAHPVEAPWVKKLMATLNQPGVGYTAQLSAARQGFAQTALALWDQQQVAHAQTVECALVGGHDALACALMARSVHFAPKDTHLRQAIQYRCPQAMDRMLTESLSLDVLINGLRTALLTHQWTVAERLWETPVAGSAVPLKLGLDKLKVASLLVNLLESKQDEVGPLNWLVSRTAIGNGVSDALTYAVETHQMTCAQALLNQVNDWGRLRARLVKSSQPNWAVLDHIGMLCPVDQQQEWVKQTRGAEDRLPLMVAAQRQREALVHVPAQVARRRLRS